MKRLLFGLIVVLSGVGYCQCGWVVDIDHVLCNGDSTGAVTFWGEDGTAPYDFEIQDPGSSVIYTGGPSTLSDLSPGVYSISMTDDAGCSAAGSFEIYEPDPLAFWELGYDPCFCDPANENGTNGVVWAAAGGGTPDYTYNWTYLGDGSSSNNTTWGGRECGTYVMTVTDGNGCTLEATIEMEQQYPEADFDIISSDLDPIPYGYVGFAPVSFYCENTSTGMQNWNDPLSDTGTYYWQLGDWAPWDGPVGIAYEPSTTLSYGGSWGIKLVAETYTGCLDTAIQFISLFGPAGIESQVSAMVSIVPDQKNQLLKVGSKGVEGAMDVRVYSVSGQLVLEAKLESEQELIDFNHPNGIYLYELIPQNKEYLRQNGKFKF